MFIPKVMYRVRSGNKWSKEIDNRTLQSNSAGTKGSPITDIAVGFNTGKWRYRVHLKNEKKWLPWVTKYDINDSIHGYAGIGKPIDAIQIYFQTPQGMIKDYGYLKAKYRVSPLNIISTKRS